MRKVKNQRQSVALKASIDLNLLPVFLEVAASSSFSEAARTLGVKRSSVSRAIATLEASLGVQLFNRTTRQVALTSAGRALRGRVGPQLALLKDSLGALPDQEERPSGVLRLAAPPDLGAMVLPPIVTAFSQRYPEVRVDVALSSRVVDLVREGIDLALRVGRKGRLEDSSLLARKVLTLDLQLFASPTYLAQAGTPRTADELRSHEWVMFGTRSFLAPLSAPTRPPRLVCDDIFFVYQALKAGAGIGALPGYLAREDLTRGTLVRVAPRLKLGAGTLFLVHPPAQHVPRKVSAFIQFFSSHLARHPLA